MREFLINKYVAAGLLALIGFLTPIMGALLFIALLVVSDLAFGILAAIKEHRFEWEKVWSKGYAGIAYFMVLIVSRAIEVYTADQVQATKVIVIGIMILELKGMGKNLKIITGKDILKIVVDLIQPKANGNKNS